jgi:MFS family permease
VNVALPAIGRDFGAPVEGLQWTIDAYLLVIASLLMLSGSTADRVGRRRGSMLNPVAMAIVTNTFIEPGERARAIGLWGSVFGLSIALGPVVGGALVDSVGRRGVFWVKFGSALGVATTGRTASLIASASGDKLPVRAA